MIYNPQRRDPNLTLSLFVLSVLFYKYKHLCQWLFILAESNALLIFLSQSYYMSYIYHYISQEGHYERRYYLIFLIDHVLPFAEDRDRCAVRY